MAPPSIRKGKRPTDDPITMRVKYMYGAAKAYETSAPVLAAYLGREALKVLQITSRSSTASSRVSVIPALGQSSICADLQWGIEGIVTGVRTIAVPQLRLPMGMLRPEKVRGTFLCLHENGMSQSVLIK